MNGPKIAAVLGLLMNAPLWAHNGFWLVAIGWLLAAFLVTRYLPSR